VNVNDNHSDNHSHRQYSHRGTTFVLERPRSDEGLGRKFTNCGSGLYFNGFQQSVAHSIDSKPKNSRAF